MISDLYSLVISGHMTTVSVEFPKFAKCLQAVWTRLVLLVFTIAAVKTGSWGTKQEIEQMKSGLAAGRG